MRLLAWAVVVVLAAGTAGCGPDRRHDASGDAGQSLAVLRRFAQCARDHGHPAFPDPVLDNGEVSFPVEDQREIKNEIASILSQVPECKAIMDSYQGTDDRRASPPSAADLAKLKRFAACIREHGLPEFPDPLADGTFPLSGTPLATEGKSERAITAMDACKDIYDGKIAVS